MINFSVIVVPFIIFLGEIDTKRISNKDNDESSRMIIKVKLKLHY